MILESCGQAGAYVRRRVDQDQLPGRGGDAIGMQRLATAVIEDDGRRRWNVRGNVLGDRAVMHVAMPGADVERVLGIPEGDPIAHGAALGGGGGPKKRGRPPLRAGVA